MRHVLTIFFLLPLLAQAQGWTIKTTMYSDSSFGDMEHPGTRVRVKTYLIHQDTTVRKIYFTHQDFRDTTKMHMIVIPYERAETGEDVPEPNAIYYRTGGYGNVIYHTGAKPWVEVSMKRPGPGAFSKKYYNP